MCLHANLLDPVIVCLQQNGGIFARPPIGGGTVHSAEKRKPGLLADTRQFNFLKALDPCLLVSIHHLEGELVKWILLSTWRLLLGRGRPKGCPLLGLLGRRLLLLLWCWGLLWGSEG